MLNGGSGTPGPLVEIPGVYTGNEPGILINIYYPVNIQVLRQRLYCLTVVDRSRPLTLNLARQSGRVEGKYGIVVKACLLGPPASIIVEMLYILFRTA